MSETASLTYYIFEGVLVGRVGDYSFRMFAYSGGGGGSTSDQTDPNLDKERRIAPELVNNVYRLGALTTGKGENHRHGGPIPPGRYTIGKPGPHGSFNLCAVLSGPAGFYYGRTGEFRIHASGPRGSDGCIVPENYSEFEALMRELIKTNGGTLYVMENMGNDRFA